MRPALRFLKLHREGSLMIQVSGDKHCGHASAIDKEERLQVRYEVDLQCAPTLNEMGFLADQTSIHNAVVEASKGLQVDSCELLAMEWGAKVLDLIYTENPHIEVHELVFQVSSFPHKGWMTAVYRV